jgi:hypothetical protein
LEDLERHGESKIWICNRPKSLELDEEEEEIW